MIEALHLCSTVTHPIAHNQLINVCLKKVIKNEKSYGVVEIHFINEANGLYSSVEKTYTPIGSIIKFSKNISHLISQSKAIKY